MQVDSDRERSESLGLRLLGVDRLSEAVFRVHAVVREPAVLGDSAHLREAGRWVLDAHFRAVHRTQGQVRLRLLVQRPREGQHRGNRHPD
mgnify:CR=1 FL=1